jgi:hypothetical protein
VYQEKETTKRLIPLQHAEVGDFGVAKFSNDKRWYRARIFQRKEGQLVDIVFIDFGNIETQRESDFYPLEARFAELPAYAIACSLSEVGDHKCEIYHLIINLHQRRIQQTATTMILFGHKKLSMPSANY